MQESEQRPQHGAIKAVANTHAKRYVGAGSAAGGACNYLLPGLTHQDTVTSMRPALICSGSVTWRRWGGGSMAGEGTGDAARRAASSRSCQGGFNACAAHHPARPKGRPKLCTLCAAPRAHTNAHLWPCILRRVGPRKSKPLVGGLIRVPGHARLAANLRAEALKLCLLQPPPVVVADCVPVTNLLTIHLQVHLKQHDFVCDQRAD